MPPSLWASSSTDVGLVDCSPVTFDFDCPSPIWIPQYPHKPEAETGIAETIQGLLNEGVLRPSQSPWNTPILPVKKPNSDKYKMAHDLRAINKIITTPTVGVPNPHCVLSLLGPQHKYYTCIDLANAFYSLPLADELTPLLAFTFRGHRYEYTRLPQGFILSPGIFNRVLRNKLQDSNPDSFIFIGG